MNILKKLAAIIIIFINIMTISVQIYNKNLSSIETANFHTPINVSVFFNNYDITSLTLLTEEMKKIEKENPETVKYTFYDGKGDQHEQDTQLDNALAQKNVDLVIADLVDSTHTKQFIDRIEQDDVYVIFLYNADAKAVQSYSKAFIAGPSPKEGGELQASIIVDAWNKKKSSIDKNHDNILQYIFLLGSPNNIYSNERAASCLLTLEKNNIPTQQLAKREYYWNKALAKDAINQLFLRFGDNIEGIFAPSDDLAIGAIEALQEHGYNLEGSEKKIMVVGIVALPEALDLIKKGVMTGTVIENTKTAEDLYTFAINLMNSKNIIDGTDCTIDSSGKIITIPYGGIVINLEGL